MPTLCLPDSIDTPSPARSSSMNQVHRPHAPAVNWRTHLSLLLLALVYVFSYIDRNVIAILIEPIKREFGASDTAMGLLTGLAFGVLYAVMGIPLGRLADQGFNRRNMVAMACGLWSLATMACGMAGQFWQLMIARMTVAIGEAGGMAPSMSMVSDLYPKERRSIAISLFMMGPHIGMILAMALGGWIAQQHGWRATFLFFGIPGLVLATLLWLIVREPRRGGFDGVPTAATQPAQPLLAQLRGLLGIRAFLLVCLACGLGGIAGYGYGIWGPSFLMRSHDLPLAQAGLLFGLASGLGAASGAIFGLDGVLLAWILLDRQSMPDVTPKRVILMIALSLYSGFTAQNIDNAAHVGGLVTGFLAGLLFCALRKHRRQKKTKEVWT